jgi:hypothetical protein
MAFEEIIPGGTPPIPAPPEPNKPKESAAANSGTVSPEDALSGAAHTKMTSFSVSDLATGKGGPAVPGTPGQSVALGGLVQGKIAVDLMDSLIPALLVLLFKKLEIDVKKTDFSLTAAEKNTLAPIVEACLNSINLDFSSPWTTLLISLTVIYGGKALEKGGVQFLEKKAAESKPADPLKHEKRKPDAILKKMFPGGPSGAGQPVVSTPPDSTNKDSFVDPALADEFGRGAGPMTWTEGDVTIVEKRRKKGRAEAIQWLEENWAKAGNGKKAGGKK